MLKAVFFFCHLLIHTVRKPSFHTYLCVGSLVVSITHCGCIPVLWWYLFALCIRHRIRFVYAIWLVSDRIAINRKMERDFVSANKKPRKHDFRARNWISKFAAKFDIGVFVSICHILFVYCLTWTYCYALPHINIPVVTRKTELTIWRATHCIDIDSLCK